MKHKLFMRLSKGLLFVVAFAFAVVGCKPSTPDKYLTPDAMANILYDYHLAEGVANVSAQNDTIALRSFRSSILSKYGVSQADLDSSMVYYVRHTSMLADVYKKLSDRINAEASEMGASTSSLADGQFASGDTANVWKYSENFLLSPYSLVNRFEFKIDCDTSYHAGDRLLLDFDSRFIYQDGIREAKVVLALTYEGDSTEYVTNRISSSSHYHLEISNLGRKKIKTVRGLWLMNTPSDGDMASYTTLRLLVISNVRLIRLHTKEMPTNESSATVGDSARSALPNDSSRRFKLMDRPIPTARNDK